jgi:TonB-dependent receptor
MINRLRFVILAALCVVNLSLFAQAPAPAVKKGKIAGRVIDAKTSETILGATVKVVGTGTGGVTDLDGKYVFSIEPGVYKLSVTFVGYSPQELPNVVVKSGEITSADFILKEATTELQVVTITTVVKKGSADLLLIEQKNAESVTSGISSELIKRTPDRTAADVVKRVSGTSVQDGKFVIVRGLGDRYNYGMINGAPFPSSESDRKAFSLDLIPSPMIESVVISKTASPDQPGDFAGGVVSINTKDIPFGSGFFVQAGAGTHSLTTGKSFWQRNGSGSDILGYDKDSRIIPENALSSAESEAAKSNDINLVTSNSKLFNHDYAYNNSNAPLNSSFQIGGNLRSKLFGNDFGFVGSVNYSRNFRFTPFSNITYESYNLPDRVKGDEPFESVNFDNSKITTYLSGLANFSYKIGDNTKLNFRNLMIQSSEEVATNRTGSSQKSLEIRYDSVGNEDGSFFGERNYRNDYFYYYQQSNMLSSQLALEHVFKGNIRLKVVAAGSRLNREILDFSRIIYESNNVGDPKFETSRQPFQLVLNDISATNSFTPNSTGKFYSDMIENGLSGNFNLNIPIKKLHKTDLRLGGMVHTRSRDFNGRNFLYGVKGGRNINAPEFVKIRQRSIDSLFTGTVDLDSVLLFESTRPSDRYDASSNLGAGFLMVDSYLAPWARFIGGVRLETFNQKLNSVTGEDTINVNTTKTDLLPSGSLIFNFNEKTNLRINGSQTVSRPEFREFAPLAFYEINLNSIVVGNDKLVRTKVTNLDAKFEWYPQDGETFSINPFYKRFTNTVEQVVTRLTPFREVSYVNAKEANNYGVEFEARLSLARFSEKLAPITIFGNYAIIRSVVKNDDTALFQFTERPLSGQSPYVLNAGIQYSNAEKAFDLMLSVNRIGRRIQILASSERQFIWENPRTVVDFSITKTLFKKLQMRLTAGDLLAQDLTWYEDLNLNGKFDEGADAKTFNFKYGRTVSFSLNYTF